MLENLLHLDKVKHLLQVGPLHNNPLALVVPQVILLLPHQALAQVIAQAVVAVPMV